jgi:DNA-binding NarL/FixJ family response regulator
MNRKVRVLICDDHDQYRECIKSFLRSAESRIEVVGEAADGLQAVDSILATNPDVVLMDVDMPRLDGIEATRRIKEVARHIHVVFLSMYDDDQIAARCLDAGASGYVLKGIDCARLTEVIVAVDSGRTMVTPQTYRSA